MALKLEGARIIDCSTFRDMVCRFENMRYLSLSGTFYVKSDAVSALASAGQQLQQVRPTPYPLAFTLRAVTERWPATVLLKMVHLDTLTLTSGTLGELIGLLEHGGVARANTWAVGCLVSDTEPP